MINPENARQAQDENKSLAEYIKQDLEQAGRSEPEHALLRTAEELTIRLRVAEGKAAIAKKVLETLAIENLKTKF